MRNTAISVGMLPLLLLSLTVIAQEQEIPVSANEAWAAITPIKYTCPPPKDSPIPPWSSPCINQYTARDYPPYDVPVVDPDLRDMGGFISPEELRDAIPWPSAAVEERID